MPLLPGRVRLTVDELPGLLVAQLVALGGSAFLEPLGQTVPAEVGGDLGRVGRDEMGLPAHHHVDVLDLVAIVGQVSKQLRKEPQPRRKQTIRAVPS